MYSGCQSRKCHTVWTGLVSTHQLVSIVEIHLGNGAVVVVGIGREHDIWEGCLSLGSEAITGCAALGRGDADVGCRLVE